MSELQILGINFFITFPFFRCLLNLLRTNIGNWQVNQLHMNNIRLFSLEICQVWLLYSRVRFKFLRLALINWQASKLNKNGKCTFKGWIRPNPDMQVRDTQYPISVRSSCTTNICFSSCMHQNVAHIYIFGTSKSVWNMAVSASKEGQKKVNRNFYMGRCIGQDRSQNTILIFIAVIYKKKRGN